MANICVILFITFVGFRCSFLFGSLISLHISITAQRHSVSLSRMNSSAPSVPTPSNPPGHKHPSDMRVITNSLNWAESERRSPSVDRGLSLTPWHWRLYLQQPSWAGKRYASLEAPLWLWGKVLLRTLVVSAKLRTFALRISLLCTKQPTFFPIAHPGWERDETGIEATLI